MALRCYPKENPGVHGRRQSELQIGISVEPRTNNAVRLIDFSPSPFYLSTRVCTYDRPRPGVVDHVYHWGAIIQDKIDIVVCRPSYFPKLYKIQDCFSTVKPVNFTTEVSLKNSIKACRDCTPLSSVLSSGSTTVI